MNSTEQVAMIDRVFLFIRDFHAQYSQLMDAAASVVKGMRASGHTARVVDYKHGQYITVQVDDHDFKIFRTPGWHFYEVRMLK